MTARTTYPAYTYRRLIERQRSRGLLPADALMVCALRANAEHPSLCVCLAWCETFKMCWKRIDWDTLLAWADRVDALSRKPRTTYQLLAIERYGTALRN